MRGDNLREQHRHASGVFHSAGNGGGIRANPPIHIATQRSDDRTAGVLCN